MRVIYVPRRDTATVIGGDIIHIRQIQHKIQQMGVEFDIVPIDDLELQKGADALYLTQIYQIEVAERAVQWAKARRIPVFISPLWEDSLPMNFHVATTRQGKWQAIMGLIGRKAAKHLYVQWHTWRRGRHPVWHRQRAILQDVHLITNTHRELRHTCVWFSLPSVEASVVRLGIDPSIFDSVPSDDTDLPPSLLPYVGKYILQVGLISTRKNQDGLLAALQNVKRSIVLVGQFSTYEPTYCERVRALAATQGHVIFLNSLELQSLAATYRHAALHILPSWSERPGMVTLEAAACECRAVASHGASVDEYLGDRIGYCDPDSRLSIADSVENALQSNEVADTSAYIRSSYTWDNTAANLKATFELRLGR